MHISVGKCTTPDSIDTVKAFYQDRIGNEVTTYKKRDGKGKAVVEIKPGGDVTAVSPKGQFEGTRLELVHVPAGEGFSHQPKAPPSA